MNNQVYEYSADKNEYLIKERHISFEEIIAALNNGQLLDIIDHPNQSIYVIQVNGYVYLVPFVEKNKQFF